MTKHMATLAPMAELQAEAPAGKLMDGSLARRMAMGLVQKHIGAPAAPSLAARTGGGLDRRRLIRVLDYIEANLEGDLGLDRMASIACLSRYHFARVFKRAVGHSPHRYVSARRLERAKTLLIEDDRPLVDIALALGFSSQANFTRAFRQATGRAPGQFRQDGRSRQRDPLLADISGLFRSWLESANSLSLPLATNDNAAILEAAKGGALVAGVDLGHPVRFQAQPAIFRNLGKYGEIEEYSSGSALLQAD
jgi:AraC-like DNA-binding protein